MKTNLEIYLGNHLSGAEIAIEMLRALIEKHRDELLGSAVEKLMDEIVADREELRRIADKLGAKTPRGRQVLARWSAHIGRRKLRKANRRSFSTFQALEALSLGIAGKEALWRALDETMEDGSADFIGISFERLIERATAQREVVEKFRVELAPLVLGSAEKSAGTRLDAAR
ncbi:MAG: hypothetical protein QM715_08320 [Nibricoccus sp.]